MTINGTLKILVLKVLSKDKANGSLILERIENKTGWRASPGSLYPLMQELVELEFVNFTKEANIKTYSITKKGSKFLADVKNKKYEITKKIEEGIEFLKIIGEKKQATEILQKTKKDYPLILPFQEQLNKLDKTISKINIKKNQNSIKNIFEETIKKLEDLK